jgi:hypothetical protein
MTPFITEEFSWYFVQQLLEWLLIVTACYCGVRLVRAYELRSRPRSKGQGSKQNHLKRRVRELEKLTEELGAQVQQLHEADRFASALMLKEGAADRVWNVERSERRAEERTA